MNDLLALNRANWSPEDHWSWMSDKLIREELEIAIVILWSIWGFRNTINQNSSAVDNAK